MNGKETLKTRGFLFLPTDIFDIPSLKFTTPEIAEKFALPMTKLEQRFDDTCSMAKYLIDFARDVDQIIEHLIQAVRDGDLAKRKWLNAWPCESYFNTTSMYLTTYSNATFPFRQNGWEERKNHSIQRYLAQSRIGLDNFLDCLKISLWRS